MSGIAPLSFRLGRNGHPIAAALLTVALLASAPILLSPVPAAAQLSDTESLINRLIRLEREVQTLNLQVYRGAPAPATGSGTATPVPEGYAAQFEVRLSQIERQLRELTGQMEQSQFRVRQINDRLDRALTDIEYRLTLLEGGEPPAPGTVPYAVSDAGAPPVPAPAPAVGAPTPLAGAGADATAGPGTGALTAGELAAEPAPLEPTTLAAASTEVALPPGDATTQYDFAYGLLAQGDYDRAEQALVLFADSHPDHPLTSNARYWLGETFYARGRFDDAAIAFAQGYQSFPQGAKAVDSLLKLGMALAAAGNRADACLTLNQLDVEFPNAPTGIKRRATQERSRLQCT